MGSNLWVPGKDPRSVIAKQTALVKLVKEVFGEELGMTDLMLALKEYTAIKGKQSHGREPVAIGFPMVGQLTPAFFVGWCRLRQMAQDYMIPVIDTTLLSASRNKVVEIFLGSNYNWLLFLDSDVMPPPDGIDRLMAHGKKVVSGLYHQKGGDFYPNMYTYRAWDPVRGQHDYNWITDWPQGELVEVDGVGAGFLLIHREVLEAIGDKDWFHFKEGGEDLAFCRQAKEKGFSIWVDTSVKCGHVAYMVISTDHYQARRLGIQHKEEITEAINKVAGGKTVSLRMLHTLKADACEYLNIAPSDYVAKGQEGTRALAATWEKTRPVSQEALNAFYNDNAMNYILDLAVWHTDWSPMRDQFPLLVRKLMEENVKTALDFGGGIGTLSLLLADNGCQVTLYDLSEGLLDFARWRARKHGVGLTIISDPALIASQYDCTVLFDVLEHLPDYPRVVRESATRSPFLLIDAPFQGQVDDADLHPQHIRELPGQGVNDLMRLHGYKTHDGHLWKREKEEALCAT